MLKDLLEKFDKEFHEQFVDESGVNDRSPDDIKSLAHSHIEAAYRAGMNVWLSVQDLYQEGFKAGHQSNLERLIEKLPKTIELKDSAEGFGRFALLWDEKGWRAGYNEMLPYEGEFLTKECFGSTPTEAVENLIKALNKQ